MARSKKAQEAIDGVMGMENVEGQVGLGVDIVEIARMKRILGRTRTFATRVFSEAEREYCQSKAAPEVHFATRFAAKEAVVKALGTGFSEGIDVRDIEVRRTAKGRPYVVLTGRAREVARELGVREIPISLSFTHTEAVACAMAITEDSVAAAKKRVDPTEELARQFKEARALLDELPANGQTTPAPGGADAPGASAAIAPGAADAAGGAAAGVDAAASAYAGDGASGAAPSAPGDTVPAAASAAALATPAPTQPRVTQGTLL